jgi:hypothetical protein
MGLKTSRLVGTCWRGRPEHIHHRSLRNTHMSDRISVEETAPFE